MNQHSIASVEDRPLTASDHYWRLNVLISTYFAYVGFYLTRKVFTICKKTLVDDFGFSYNGVGYIWTSYLIGYMVGQFINSYLGRRWGPRVLLLGGLGISIVINLIFGFTNSFSTFLVFMLFNGIVQAAGWPGAVGGVAEWLRRRERGTIMGIWSTNFTVGNIVVKTLAGYLLFECTKAYGAQFGVRYAFWGCTLLAFAIWWLILLCQRTKPEDVGLMPMVEHVTDDNQTSHTAPETDTQGSYWSLLTNPIVLLMGLSYFSIKTLRYALDSWLPTFLDLQGMNVKQSGYYSSIFDWAGLAGAILAGYAMDRLFRGRWDVVCTIMGLGIVVGYWCVARYGTTPVLLAVWFGLVGFMLYGPDTLLGGAGCVAVAGQRNAVAVAGIVNGLGSIGPVLQETVLGSLLDQHKLAPAIAVQRANQLGLFMSILFVVSIASVSIAIQRAKAQPADPLAGKL